MGLRSVLFFAAKQKQDDGEQKQNHGINTPDFDAQASRQKHQGYHQDFRHIQEHGAEVPAPGRLLRHWAGRTVE